MSEEPRIAKSPFVAHDGTRYERVVREGKAFWSSGDGTFTGGIREKLAGGRTRLVVPEPGPEPIPQRARLGDAARIELKVDGIDHVVETKDGGERRTYVVSGHVEPLEPLDVDGDYFVRVRLDREIVVRPDELVKILRREGRVMSRRYVDDAIGAMVSKLMPRPVRQVHATLGVYARADGKLEFCDAPHPLYKEQETALADSQTALGVEGTKADVEAYVGLVDRLQKYEILPAMGLAAIAPFALVLRQRNVLVPHLFHWSPQHGLGKSKVAEAFTERLYARRPIGADALASEFRFASQMDAAGLPLCVNEASGLEQRKVGAAFKDAAEREVVDKRGQPDLGMVTYRARSVLLLTGNAFPFSNPSVLVRILGVRFDDRKARERHHKEARQEFDVLMSRLRPIGYDLTRYALSRYEYLERLVVEVEILRGNIEKAYPGELRDPRRAQAWACVYLGLELWESYASFRGAEWKRPNVQEFVDWVVVPVEASTFEGGIVAVHRFASWWARFRVMNLDRTGTAKGFGQLWTTDAIRAGEDMISGTLVPSAVLDDYNANTEPEFTISSLAELGRQVSTEWGLDLADIAGKDGRGLVRKISGKGNVRVVFVPETEDFTREDTRKGGSAVENDPPMGKNPLPGSETVGSGFPMETDPQSTALPRFGPSTRVKTDDHKLIGPVHGYEPCETCGHPAKWYVTEGAFQVTSCEACLSKYGLEPPRGKFP
jgi:hypothetical protein